MTDAKQLLVQVFNQNGGFPKSGDSEAVLNRKRGWIGSLIGGAPQHPAVLEVLDRVKAAVGDKEYAQTLRAFVLAHGFPVRASRVEVTETILRTHPEDRDTLLPEEQAFYRSFPTISFDIRDRPLLLGSRTTASQYYV